MIKSLTLAMATVVAGLSASAVLACPNPAGAPNYGAESLEAGFLPDPATLDLAAGGDSDLASCLGGRFAGFVSESPDFDLYWSGNGGPLTIAVETDAVDAVLLINDPAGNWHFNDDYRGLNPAITFNNPRAGLYDIWVGSYDGSVKPARLIVTELNY